MREGILKNTAFGAFLGLIAGILFSRALGSDVLEDAQRLYTATISAFITLGGASLALYGVFANIDNQNRNHAKTRDDRLVAARATLPLALSELVGICKNRVQFEIDRKPERRDANWTLSDVGQKTFKECIEFSDSGPRETLVEICAIYQIMVARNGFVDDEDLPVRSAQITSEIVGEYHKLIRMTTIRDWLTLECIAEELFRFGRTGVSFPSRVNVLQRVKFKVQNLEHEGWLIENDNEIGVILRRFAEMQNFAFTDLNWRDKARVY